MDAHEHRVGVEHARAERAVRLRRAAAPRRTSATGCGRSSGSSTAWSACSRSASSPRALGRSARQSGAFDLRKAQLYLLIGALLWGYLSLVFMEAAYAIAWERWEGTIEYTFMAPVRRVTHLIGICLFAIGYGLVAHVHRACSSRSRSSTSTSRTPTSPGALAVLAASTVPLIGLGILTVGAAAALAAEGRADVGRGAGLPAARLGRLLPAHACCRGRCRSRASASPLTYALAGMRRSLLDGRRRRATSCRPSASCWPWAWC